MSNDPFTPEEREQVIQGAIATQALAGITVSREIAEQAYESAMRSPMPEIGTRKDHKHE